MLRVAFFGSTQGCRGPAFFWERLRKATLGQVLWEPLTTEDILKRPKSFWSRFDVIYTTSPTHMIFLSGAKISLPIVWHLLGEAHNRELLKVATRIVTVTPTMEKLLLETTPRVSLLETAVPDCFSPGTKDPSLTSPLPSVLYCGVLTRFKGTDLLIQALADQACNLWLVGTDLDRPGILRTLPPNVTRWGQQPPLRFYQSADLFVLPSSTEGMSQSMLEAMACGLPCVASNIAANRDTLRGSGVLCDLTVESIQEKVLGVLSDEALRKDLSAKSLGVSRTRNFSDWRDRLVSILVDACSS